MDGINLTPTLMFDYPTVPDLVDYIWSQASGGQGRHAEMDLHIEVVVDVENAHPTS